MPAIDTAVTDALSAAGINYQTTYAGEVRKWGSPVDAWKVTFTRGARAASFPYFMGLGHRKAWRSKTELSPVPPTAAGVLALLITDAAAREMSFALWCSDYGYSTDSRSALTTYETCQKHGDALAVVLGDTWSAFAALVEGY